MPHHHVPADALVAYAAGVATPGEDLLVACHLSLCPDCREVVERAEGLGDELLLKAPEVPLGAGALEALLGKLDAPAEPKPPPPPPCSVFPAPLRRLVGNLEGVSWRSIGAGLRAAHVDLGEDKPEQRVFLLDFPPGFRIPTHGHTGLERLLVLRGSYIDEQASFSRGDVSWREQGDHQVVISDEERCTSLFVNDGPADIGPVLTPLFDWWLGG